LSNESLSGSSNSALSSKELSGHGVFGVYPKFYLNVRSCPALNKLFYLLSSLGDLAESKSAIYLFFFLEICFKFNALFILFILFFTIFKCFYTN